MGDVTEIAHHRVDLHLADQPIAIFVEDTECFVQKFIAERVQMTVDFMIHHQLEFRKVDHTIA